MSERDIRSDSKMKGDALSEEQHQELWELRYPAGETERLPLEEIAALEVPRICRITCSVSTLHAYYKWAKQRKRTRRALERSQQAKRELLEQNPDATPDELERLGQMIFTSETVEDGDIKGFVALMKASNARKKLDLDSRRVTLLEVKARKADEAEEVAKDGTISNTEKQARLKQIFGIGD